MAVGAERPGAVQSELAAHVTQCKWLFPGEFCDSAVGAKLAFRTESSLDRKTGVGSADPT